MLTAERPHARREVGAPAGRGRSLGLLLLVVLVVATLVAHQRFDLGRSLTLAGMRALVESHGPYGPLVFIGICVVGFFFRLPQIVLIALGGVLFAPTHAFAYAWIASVIGTTSTFLLVRYCARDTFQRLLIGRFARLRALDARLERHGFLTVLCLRLVLFLSPPLNWAIGATRVRIRHYVGGTALGVIPGIAALVVFADAIAKRGPDDALLDTKTVVVALLIIGFVIASVIAGRRLLSKPGGTSPP